MTTLGIDFSFARIAGADIKAHGYDFVCRYLASFAGKRITVAEVSDFHNNGLGIVLVWEDEANAALGGFAKGQIDAQEALKQSTAVGFPSNIPLYFAVDFDATEAQQILINAYFDGIISVLGLARTGGYGGYYVIKRLFDAGKITYGWQAVAWSGGQVDPRIHIYQNGGSAFSGQADLDEARQTNFGQWTKEGTKVEQPADYNFVANASQILLGRPEPVTQEWYNSAPERNMTRQQVYDEFANSKEAQNFRFKGWDYPKLAAQVTALQKQLAAKNVITDIKPAPKTLPQLVNNTPPPARSTDFTQPNIITRFWQAIWGRK